MEGMKIVGRRQRQVRAARVLRLPVSVSFPGLPETWANRERTARELNVDDSRLVYLAFNFWVALYITVQSSCIVGQYGG